MGIKRQLDELAVHSGDVFDTSSGPMPADAVSSPDMATSELRFSVWCGTMSNVDGTVSSVNVA